MSETLYKRLQCRFAPQAGRQWGHLSRMTNLLIVLNVSLFFLTNLVTQQGYYYTFYSIFFLSLAGLGAVLPFGLLNRLWYYSVFLFCDLIGAYFIVVSVWYWVNASNAPLAG